MKTTTLPNLSAMIYKIITHRSQPPLTACSRSSLLIAHLSSLISHFSSLTAHNVKERSLLNHDAKILHLDLASRLNYKFI